MLRAKIYSIITICFGPIGLFSVVHGQAVPTASKSYTLSAFSAGNLTYTGLEGEKNSGITAGVDLSFHRRFGLYPSFEVRGTYPLAMESVGSVKNLLGGILLVKHFGNIHPYADILVGRGEITYGNGGYPNPEGTYQYLQSASTVISPGIGADYPLTRSWALKGDFQFQRYSTPVTASGTLFTKPISIGVVYTLNFGHDGLR